MQTWKIDGCQIWIVHNIMIEIDWYDSTESSALHNGQFGLESFNAILLV